MYTFLPDNSPQMLAAGIIVGTASPAMAKEKVKAGAWAKHEVTHYVVNMEFFVSLIVFLMLSALPQGEFTEQELDGFTETKSGKV